MKIKTNELIGPALDWAAAKCEGFTYANIMGHATYVKDGSPSYGGGYSAGEYSPSTDWAQGGPIMEREKINTEYPREGFWLASMWHEHTHELTCHHSDGSGETLLIAAMRCYVASKLGEEVEIPEEIA